MEKDLKAIGGAEECSSSESGWTMYLSSPMHGDDDDHAEGGIDDSDDNHGYKLKGHENDDDDDDDSMASDASSGPAHYNKGSNEKSYEEPHPPHVDDDDINEPCSSKHPSSYKKAHKVERKRDERVKKASAVVPQRKHRGSSSLHNTSNVRGRPT